MKVFFSSGTPDYVVQAIYFIYEILLKITSSTNAYQVEIHCI